MLLWRLEDMTDSRTESLVEYADNSDKSRSIVVE